MATSDQDLQRRPLVSILMNCYNGETYLDQSVSSVLSQTYTHWELLFWDNQSTDRSAEICRAIRDPRVRYLRSPSHTSLGQARVDCMKTAQGKYIAILDTDDVWMPERLERQVDFMEASEETTLVGSWSIQIDESSQEIGRRQPPVQHEEIVQHLGYENPFTNPTVMFNKEIADSIGGYDPKYPMYQDCDLWIRLSLVKKIRIIPEFLAQQRVHKHQLSRQKFSVELLHETYSLLRSAQLTLPLNRNSKRCNISEQCRCRALLGLALLCHGQPVSGARHMITGFFRSPWSFISPQSLRKAQRYFFH